ncbi:MAG: ABC transporter permease [Gammaproteobacteria bacterium]|nr:MAG: ABC transporter permease [Gammaproteobacteria bacterium]TND03243.1 MAG: ABC transporter permease [Gammaproteobacteria bacterium]
MIMSVVAFAAGILYVTTGVLLAYRLSRGAAAIPPRGGIILLLGTSAVALHALFLSLNILTADGLNFSFFNAVSLLSWLIAVLFLLATLTSPVENLGIVILPLAALAILLETVLPSQHTLIQHAATGIGVHILISILAYSLLAIAAVQAILLAIQDRHLRNRHPGGFIRALPPLNTMETLLFQLIGVGFTLQSVSLVTGFVYMESMFAQHLAHKTVLSIIAWSVFATLLWGRWRFGWRGRVAIRWTLSGFVALMLAYLGSKLVLELILQRSP